MNRVVLVGRITKDPDLRYTSSQIAVVSFTIAVNRTYQKQNGEREADFINCVVWRTQAENLAKFVKKGQLIGVDGRIQTRTYEQDGQTRYVTEVLCDQITFLEPKSSSNSNSNNEFNKNNDVKNEPEEDDFYKSTEKLNISEEDLPF